MRVLVSVTRPVEEAMNGLPGVNRIRSTTQRGGCDISLFFDWKVDIKESLQMVQERLAEMETADFGTMKTCEFILYHSKLSPRGAHYTALARFLLEQS